MAGHVVDADARERLRRDAEHLADEEIGPHDQRKCYLEITEGRTDWTTAKGLRRRYGWCGDFATFVCMRQGVTDGRVLNRAILNDGVWVPGDNIARIVRWAQQHAGLISGDSIRHHPDSIVPGDMLVFARTDGDHIAVFGQWIAAGRYITFDGNSWGGTTKRNARVIGEGMPIRAGITSLCFPVNTIGRSPFAFHNPAFPTKLPSELVALGGDSSELLQ